MVWFSIFASKFIFLQICTPKSSTILKCIAPKLPADVELEVLERKRNTASTISYTITMDGADGPNSSARDLQLTVKPDPEFFMLHMEDREYTLESGHTIRILVCFILSPYFTSHLIVSIPVHVHVQPTAPVLKAGHPGVLFFVVGLFCGC